MATIEVADFASAGVTLACALDADFDAGAQEILGGRAEPVLDLKPYLAIVANRGARTVVAYTVCWATTLRNESTEFLRTQFKFPDALAGAAHGLPMLRNREIWPGERRLVGPGFEVWPAEYAGSYREFGKAAIQRLGDVKGLRISLDAVIFEDGEMLGADDSGLAEHLITFLQAKQTLYRELVAGLESGGLAEDLWAPLRSTLTSRQVPDPSDLPAIYQRMAAGEVLGFHNRVVLEVFRRALRREPFSIRRGE